MTVRAYAKVNLTLEVFGVRADGYHALRSLVAPVSLFDTLEIDEDESFSSDTGYADDLSLKAARVLDPTRGVRVRIAKSIPAGGGLGGGSADAAAVLNALNASRRLGLDRAALAALGAKVGSDVPSLVWGGSVVMEGRGECVTPLASFPELDLVIVHPNVFCATPAVFAASSPRAADVSSALDGLRDALASGELGRIAAAFVNDLEAPATRLHPEIADARAALLQAGAIGASMTGSGSCVFGLMPDAPSARQAAETLSTGAFRAWPVKTQPATLTP